MVRVDYEYDYEQEHEHRFAEQERPLAAAMRLGPAEGYKCTYSAAAVKTRFCSEHGPRLSPAGEHAARRYRIFANAALMSPACTME